MSFDVRFRCDSIVVEIGLVVCLDVDSTHEKQIVLFVIEMNSH